MTWSKVASPSALLRPSNRRCASRSLESPDRAGRSPPRSARAPRRGLRLRAFTFRFLCERPGRKEKNVRLVAKARRHDDPATQPAPPVMRARSRGRRHRRQSAPRRSRVPAAWEAADPSCGSLRSRGSRLESRRPCRQEPAATTPRPAVAPPELPRPCAPGGSPDRAVNGRRGSRARRPAPAPARAPRRHRRRGP